ncbi:hypothetical protein BDR26DRAFT_938018 [Obelidium mucronatum]|nr:hypothetical protein BDR26DRAFT_938018 [Obelidium mucronatum]
MSGVHLFESIGAFSELRMGCSRTQVALLTTSKVVWTHLHHQRSTATAGIRLFAWVLLAIAEQVRKGVAEKNTPNIIHLDGEKCKNKWKDLKKKVSIYTNTLAGKAGTGSEAKDKPEHYDQITCFMASSVVSQGAVKIRDSGVGTDPKMRPAQQNKGSSRDASESDDKSVISVDTVEEPVYRNPEVLSEKQQQELRRKNRLDAYDDNLKEYYKNGNFFDESGNPAAPILEPNTPPPQQTFTEQLFSQLVPPSTPAKQSPSTPARKKETATKSKKYSSSKTSNAATQQADSDADEAKPIKTPKEKNRKQKNRNIEEQLIELQQQALKQNELAAKQVQERFEANQAAEQEDHEIARTNRIQDLEHSNQKFLLMMTALNKSTNRKKSKKRKWSKKKKNRDDGDGSKSDSSRRSSVVGGN